MKSRKITFFRNVIANVVIVAIVATLGVFAFSSATLSTTASTSQNGAYYYGNRSENKVSLMFNVYGGTEYVEGILDVLVAKNVKSTFFVGGVWVEKNADTLKNLAEKGMEIGNHGYLHRDSDKLSQEGLKHEIKATENLVVVYLNKKTELFAPPSGAVNKEVTKVADSLGYKTIMWSKDTIDWRDQDVDLITKRATTGIIEGDLILMHPTKATLEALPMIIDTLQQENYLITTVSDTISPSIA